MKFDKLVRDKIPEIIADSGQRASFRVLEKAEYLLYLEKKLDEEVAEFHESKSIEELADIMEVLFATAVASGYSVPRLYEKRMKKQESHGGFSKRICLIETED